MGKLLDVFYTKKPGQERANDPDFGIEVIDEAEIDFHGETGQLFIRKTAVAQTLYGVRKFRVREMATRAPEQIMSDLTSFAPSAFAEYSDEQLSQLIAHERSRIAEPVAAEDIEDFPPEALAALAEHEVNRLPVAEPEPRPEAGTTEVIPPMDEAAIAESLRFSQSDEALDVGNYLSAQPKPPSSASGPGVAGDLAEVVERPALGKRKNRK